MSNAADRCARLFALIGAAVHDIAVAIEAWESVRPANQSEALVGQMNRARAEMTFVVIRQALDTQVLMALARLWDQRSDSIGFREIGAELSKEEVLSALEASAKASAQRRLAETRDARSGDLISITDPTRFEVLKSRLHKVNEIAIRARASEWQARYDLYRKVRIGDALRELKDVRNKRISHWDLADITSGAERTYRLHRLGRILRASELLTEKALLLAKDESHYFIETHRSSAAEAKRFWGAFGQ